MDISNIIRNGIIIGVLQLLHFLCSHFLGAEVLDEYVLLRYFLKLLSFGSYILFFYFIYTTRNRFKKYSYGDASKTVFILSFIPLFMVNVVKFFVYNFIDSNYEEHYRYLLEESFASTDFGIDNYIQFFTPFTLVGFLVLLAMYFIFCSLFGLFLGIIVKKK